jgi:predicted nucleotidyltransferase
MDIQALKNQLPSILHDLEDVCLVYLFGSQVQGDHGPMSDYDLALLVDRAADGRAADGRRIQALLAHELAHTLQTDKVDVVLLNSASIELAYAIIAEGTLLFERDIATRVEYEAYILSRYGDYLPVLRTQREDILRGDDHDRRVRRYRAALGRTERTLGQIAATQRQKSD